MDNQLTLPLETKRDVFRVCRGCPISEPQMKLATQLGPRIVPVVGGINSGAEFVMDAIRGYADSHGLKYLNVHGAPGLSAPCESIIKSISRALRGCFGQDRDLFGSLMERVIEDSYRIIIIEGASRLSDSGIRELTHFLESTNELNVDEGCAPVVLWHAKQNWERAYWPDAQPRRYFAGNLLVPATHMDVSIDEICAAFPYLGHALKACGESAWSEVMDKTDGQLGSIQELENMLQKIFKTPSLAPATKESGELLNRLLNVMFGTEADEHSISPPPNRTFSTAVPGKNGILAPPCQTRSHRGSRAKGHNRKRRARRARKG